MFNYLYKYKDSKCFYNVLVIDFACATGVCFNKVTYLLKH